LTRTIRLWAPVVLYAAVIFYASAQPDVQLPAGFTDKPTHSLAYTVLGVLMLRALAGGLPARIALSTALLAVALTTAYGATDEIHQMFVPGRYADWHDLVADAIGGATGAVVCWLWGIISPAPSRTEGPPRHGL
jgi:VanZ family protein